MCLYFLQTSSSLLSLGVRVSRKETPISVVMSVRLSVRLSAPIGLIFVEFEILYWKLLQKCVEKSKFG